MRKRKHHYNPEANLSPEAKAEAKRLRKIQKILDEPPLDKLKFVYKRKIKPNKRKPANTEKTIHKG